jgi:putative Mg2+ transporter-C (MgtC) family protein
MTSLPWLLRCLLRLLAAALLAGAIGLERERRGRSAGFRTQMLVGIGAALAIVVAMDLLRQYEDRGTASVQIDPTRVVYGVMAGIGFLGAGAIIGHGVSVRGLTTAASLWCTAAIGLACGLGLYELAAVTAVLVLIVLYCLSWIDRRVTSRWHRAVRATVQTDASSRMEEVRHVLGRCAIDVSHWGIRRDVKAGRETLTFHVSSTRASPEDLFGALSELKGLQELSIE